MVTTDPRLPKAETQLNPLLNVLKGFHSLLTDIWQAEGHLQRAVCVCQTNTNLNN